MASTAARRRVLHVSMPTVAGVPAVVVGYVAAQVARGWSVSVACPERDWLPSAARAAGARVVPWAASRGPSPLVAGETARLARLIAECDPDVVHLHSAKAGLAGRLAICGRRPTVFQPHAWSFFAAQGAVGAASLQWERFAARWTDVLLCVSDGERIAGTSSGVDAPYRVVRNGVDLRAWTHAREGDRESARADLGLQPGRPLALCVGRLCKQKGQADLVAAWPLVRSSVPDAYLVLVGDGPDRALLEQRCAAAGGIVLTGERHDVAKWMAAADVVVVPSRWDGMALVVVEAMARGRSVVATSVPGIADALPRFAGAVVAPGDRRALARALIVRLHDHIRCDAEGATGRRYVELNLDQAVSAEAVVTIYDELLAHGRPRTPQLTASVLDGPERAGSEARS